MAEEYADRPLVVAGLHGLMTFGALVVSLAAPPIPILITASELREAYKDCLAPRSEKQGWGHRKST